jgi:hypothetical protein
VTDGVLADAAAAHLIELIQVRDRFLDLASKEPDEQRRIDISAAAWILHERAIDIAAAFGIMVPSVRTPTQR